MSSHAQVQHILLQYNEFCILTPASIVKLQRKKTKKKKPNKQTGAHQIKRKSFSISPMLQNKHLRSIPGNCLYLPFSKLNEYAHILYLLSSRSVALRS